MKQFTIIEEKWARGGKNGEAKLLNDDGNMCCLGFLCQSEGAKISTGMGLPRHIPRLPKSCAALVERVNEEGFDWTIAKVNDNPSITDKQRKKELSELFSSIGFEAIYV